jgi:uncharacterized phage protein gp47/JayE
MSTPTLPLPTLAAQISATGISAPAFSDMVASEFAAYEGIYGSDTVLTPDTQDGQLISVRTLAIRDVNDLAIAVYNSFLPSVAQGVGLSAIVQINGINREVASQSTATLVLGGVAGTPIAAGVAIDTNNNLWSLPFNIVIPDTGTLTVTATAQVAGAIAAIPGSINKPYTIIAGWQTVTNPAAATPGNPVESDAALRQRQAQSTSLASVTPLSSILSNVANTGGIGRFAIFENQGNVTDDNGIPSHSVAVVVEGGNVTTIAQTIEATKAPGTGTFGTTSILVVDPAGVPITINFFEMTEVPIFVAITIQPLTGFVATTGTALVAATAALIQSLAIGEEIFYNWVLGAAALSGNPLQFTYNITALTIGLSPSTLSVENIPIAFNAGAQCSIANITLTVLS